VSVRLFARARDLAGSDCISLSVPRQFTVRTMRSALVESCAALRPIANSLLVAVNADYVNDDRALTVSDEIAVFPPVSGG